MERKPKNWQRRGIFALVSQREASDALSRYVSASEEEESEEEDERR